MPGVTLRRGCCRRRDAVFPLCTALPTPPQSQLLAKATAEIVLPVLVQY